MRSAVRKRAKPGPRRLTQLERLERERDQLLQIIGVLVWTRERRRWARPPTAILDSAPEDDAG